MLYLASRLIISSLERRRNRKRRMCFVGSRSCLLWERILKTTDVDSMLCQILVMFSLVGPMLDSWESTGNQI
jgi:hypothetical protein